jgi:hypothetical protein
MNTRASLNAVGVFAITLMAAFAAIPTGAYAAEMGGGGHIAAYGGGAHAGYGWRGGYGYRGGWRGYGYYGGWGWGWGGLGYGLFFASLPLYYSTLWWDGVPYYYSAGDYYIWNGSVGQYQTVAPPPGLANQAAGQQPAATDLYVYPKSGQSSEQQARDRFECHHWAADQTGFDPTQAGSVAPTDPSRQGAAAPPSGPSVAASPGKRQEYLRAQTACLEGRGYSVR